MEFLVLGFGAVLALIVFAYIRSEVAYRRFEFHEPAVDDHHLTIYERLPLYDHEERGDFR